jgi:type I restriction-modification system DNA methylase subunit
MTQNLERLRSIKSFPSLVKYLRDELDWEFETEDVEDLTYEYSAAEFGLDKKDAAAIRKIKQLRPLVENQPWGIFYLDFAGQKLSVGALRAILRGLVAKKRASANQSEMRKWQVEDLLFICTSDEFKNFNFAYFRGEQTARAVLSTFGWHQGDTHLRTLSEYNLPALAFPHDTADSEGWLTKWRAAFDVEAVTSKFFADYHQVFLSVEAEVQATIKTEESARFYTQRLFNRLMFIYFIQKKGWLSFKGNKVYLRALFDASDAGKENFLRDRLYWLFFSGMSNVGESREAHSLEILRERRGEVPYLNGGLFDMEDQWDERDNVAISNDEFRKILDLFERYNFTVEESTPLNVQVAVDPEMLGKVFEELVTGREARQEAGRYYTPRNIVAFMCRESLKRHLGGYSSLVDDRRADDINVPEANDLLARLDRLKIVDPACGSGAYLLGMLHELHALTNLLRTRAAQATARDDYSLKLSIIERNLYGVDKDNLAVQIARFRLWLSLIIEYDDKAGINDLPTLPNLDFKIECGDSLTAPNPEKVKSGSFRTELIKQYREAKARFLSAHGNQKGELRKEIKQLGETIRHEAAFWLYGNVTFDGFDWAIEFAEVFDNGGFDVVLANPPYGATVADNVRNLYFDRATEGPQSKDTYGLFIARSLQLLRDGGQLCFVVSDTWRTIKTHKPLRRRLAEKTKVWHVLDLPTWIFNATVNTGILTLTKRVATEEHQLIAGDLSGIGRGDWDTLTKNLLAVAAHGVDVQTLTYARYTYRQSLIPTYDNCSFFIASPLLYKLMSDPRFTKLETIADVKQGLATADNEYYLRKRRGVRGSYEILDESKLLNDAEIAAFTDDEKLNGIAPKEHGGKHFLPYDKGGESNTGEGWMPNYYVPTGYFLDWSRGAVNRLRTATIADVKRRKGQDGKIRASDETTRAAVIRSPQFYFREGVTFSRTGIYAPTYRLNSLSVFDSEGSAIFLNEFSPRTLLGLLCSIFARYIIKVFVDHTVHAQTEDIKEFITVELSEEQENQLISLVSTIIEKQKANSRYPYHLHEQREIDSLVYQLYGLTDEDIREIELWYCRRYRRLAEAQGVTEEVQEKYADHLARAERILAKPPSYWQSNPILGLIALNEGPQLECKETLEADNETGKSFPSLVLTALKTIAAFLNTDGGTLLIGVSDSGEIKGLELDFQLCRKKNVDGFELKLRDLLKTRLKAPFGNIQVSFEPFPEGDVCRIDVTPSPTITFIDGKDAYIRDGNRTEKLEGPALMDWNQRRSVNSTNTSP